MPCSVYGRHILEDLFHNLLPIFKPVTDDSEALGAFLARYLGYPETRLQGRRAMPQHVMACHACHGSLYILPDSGMWRVPSLKVCALGL